MDRHSRVECGQDQLRRRGDFGRRYGAMTTGCQMERRQARVYRLVSDVGAGLPALRRSPRRYGASRGDQPVAPTLPNPFLTKGRGAFDKFRCLCGAGMPRHF